MEAKRNTHCFLGPHLHTWGVAQTGPPKKGGSRKDIVALGIPRLGQLALKMLPMSARLLHRDANSQNILIQAGGSGKVLRNLATGSQDFPRGWPGDLPDLGPHVLLR